jgi:hypothetical protein
MERREATRQEFAQSHRQPMPDTLAIGQAVAALVVRQAQQQREEIRQRWEARQERRRERFIATLLQGTDPRRGKSFDERIQSLQKAAAPITDGDRKAASRAAISEWERQHAKDPLLIAARDADGWKALRDGVAERHRKASSSLLAWTPSRRKAAAEAGQELARIDQAMAERRAAWQAAIQRREREQRAAAEAWAHLAPCVDAARARFEADHRAWQERQRLERERKRREQERLEQERLRQAAIEVERERERQRQAAIEADRQARRQRLRELAEAMKSDLEARMDIVQAYTAAGYVLVEQDGKRVLKYQQSDLLEDRKVVQAARQAWDARKKARLAHEREEEEQARKAIHEPRYDQAVVPMLSDARPRKKTPWREWREATLVQRYGEDVAARAVREDWYIRMRPDLGGLNVVVTGRDGIRREIVDGGDAIRSGTGTAQDISLMLDLAQAKDWKELRIDGDETFRSTAALAAIKRGFALEDRALEQQARERLEAEAREKQNREVKRVSLAEFGVRRGEVISVSRDRTTLTLYCPKTDETLQVDTGGKPLPEGLKPGHYIDASRNYLSGGLNVKEAPMPKDYQRRVQIQGKLPRLDLGLER